MRIKHFCNKYDVTESNIASTIHQYPDSPIAKAMVNLGRDERYINETYLLRRYEFRRKIWLESHELYYVFMEHTKESKLSTMLAKVYGNKQQDWLQFFQYRLFSLARIDSVLNPTINDFLWKFYRFAKHFIAKADRRYDAKAFIVYNRLPNRDNYSKIYKQRLPREARRLK